MLVIPPRGGEGGNRLRSVSSRSNRDSVVREATLLKRGACLREGDAPRAGLERREDLVLASKPGPEVRAARGREKGRVPRSDFTLFRRSALSSVH